METYESAADQFIDAGECVVVLGREGGRTLTGGVEIHKETGQVWWLRDGKVTRLEAHLSHEGALRAAGLRA